VRSGDEDAPKPRRRTPAKSAGEDGAPARGSKSRAKAKN
jgi:hypothetical protein